MQLDRTAPLDPSKRLPLFKRMLVWVKLVFGNLDRNRTFGLASEMAFWLFLSLIPLAAVLGLVAARLATKNHGVVAPLLDALPAQTRDLVTGELGKVSAWNGGTVSAFAALMFLWLASSGIHGIFDALELTTETCARPWWKKRLLALATCIALSIGVALLTLLGTGFGWVQRLMGTSIPISTGNPGWIGTAVRLVLGALIAFGLVVGLYWVGLPSSARKRMPIVPGAIFAVVLSAILGFGYGFYISKAGNGGAYQAGLAVIAVTLMALYLLSIALLVGAEVNRAFGARRVLLFSVHTSIAPPPAVLPDMVRCQEKPAHRSHRWHLGGRRRSTMRPSMA